MYLRMFVYVPTLYDSLVRTEVVSFCDSVFVTV